MKVPADKRVISGCRSLLIYESAGRKKVDWSMSILLLIAVPKSDLFWRKATKRVVEEERSDGHYFILSVLSGTR